MSWQKMPRCLFEEESRVQIVGSREYKLMLHASRLAGDEARLLKAAALWDDVAAIIVPHACSVNGTPHIAHKRRQVRCLDAQERWLRAHSYVVRERVDVEKDERQVTLKFCVR